MAHQLQTAHLNAAAQRGGVSGAKRRERKIAHQHGQGDEGFTLGAFVSESYGRMHGDAVKALKALAGVAGDHGRLSKRAFLRTA